MIITESFTFDVIAVLTTVVVGVIAFVKWRFAYFSRIGVPFLEPSFLFGNTKDVLLGRISLGEKFGDFYHNFKSKGLKHFGVYLGTRPFYVPIDPDIIKHILQTDFQHFMNHGNYIDEEADPLSGHLFNLENEKWKKLRNKLSPTFTSGKMKMMFQTLVDCTRGLKNIMEEVALQHTSIDIKDVLGRFTTDIIGSVAFGLECNSMKDPNTEFRIYGKKIFEIRFIERIKLILLFCVPFEILHLFRFKFTRGDVEDFFMNLIRKTVEHREKNNIYRKDFMHLLLQLKNRGTISDDEKITTDGHKPTEKALTMNELAAQSFVFFAAGFETSSTTMTFALFELASNPDIQEKLRNEINNVLEKYNGQLTYDGMMEMTYMDKVLYETLRKYPPVPLLTRACNKDYVIPGTSVKLYKGADVGISVLGLHNDPEYYPNPKKFDPDRFSEDNKKKRPNFTWIPFGEGPRICIGLRFGLMQSKVGLTALLKDYKITLSPKTQVPLKMSSEEFITTAAGGIWLDVEKLE